MRAGSGRSTRNIEVKRNQEPAEEEMKKQREKDKELKAQGRNSRARRTLGAQGGHRGAQGDGPGGTRKGTRHPADKADEEAQPQPQEAKAHEVV